MKKLVLLGLAVISFTACHSQQHHDTNKSEVTSSKNPNGQWTVHKQYDDNGNLISKDSTYSYRYASINGKPVSPQKMDSIFSQFHNQIHANFGQMNIPNNIDLDSIEQNFFNQNMVNLQDMQDRMHEQMQAMQQQFIQQIGHQDWIPRDSKDKSNSQKYNSNSEAIPSEKI